MIGRVGRGAMNLCAIKETAATLLSSTGFPNHLSLASREAGRLGNPVEDFSIFVGRNPFAF